MVWLASQALVLLFSALYHSFALICYIPFLLLARVWCSIPGWQVPEDWQGATHWEGTVKHKRLKPVQHAFQ